MTAKDWSREIAAVTPYVSGNTVAIQGSCPDAIPGVSTLIDGSAINLVGLGEGAIDRPVTFPEVFATLYHNMGLDYRTIREFDLSGRPQYLVPEGTEPNSQVGQGAMGWRRGAQYLPSRNLTKPDRDR